MFAFGRIKSLPNPGKTLIDDRGIKNMAAERVVEALKTQVMILRNLLYNRLYASPKTEKEVVDNFHKLYYYSYTFGKTWGKTSWLGVPAAKCPLDAWIYQEIIFETKPDVIIECGTANGGSALYLASVCEMLGNGRVITIDIEDIKGRPKHDRITYILGSSVASETVEKIRKMIPPGAKVMVILDSDHHKEHVLNELRLYAPLVSKGCYLVVEDTNIGDPVLQDFGPGPRQAIEEFMRGNTGFEADRSREKFYMTFNPGGYLKKVK
jgi:cephalosporin hydroxylase